MTQQSPWNGCVLKVFCLAGPDPMESKKNMMLLLEKFRIKAVEIIPVDMQQAPSVDR